MPVKAEILNELMEISPLLAGIARVNLYTVPEGYFEGLEASVLSLIKTDDNPTVLQGIAMKNPMQAPQGYFDSLANSILEKIKAGQAQTADEELRSLSPMLYSIDKVNVFKIPTGYFENLTDNLLNKVSPKEEAKIISFSKRKTVSWMRYAAAAAVIGLVGLISFFVLHNGRAPDYDAVVKQGIDLAKQNKFDDVLNKTSNEAIASYLQKTSDEADAMQMVASVDDSQLPGEEELMSDEKLIDDLINESENKNTTN